MSRVEFGIAGIGLGVSLIAAAVVFLLLALLAPRKNKSTREIPPGPKRNFLGNTLGFPRDHFYDTFSEWNRQFGDVVYANFFGRSSLIISSREKAEELLSKRGAIYSNRPPCVLILNLMGWAGWNVALSQPGKQHTELRGLLLKGLSPSMVISYDPLVERVIETLVLCPLARSGPGGCDPAVFIERGIASILTEVAYGDSLTEEQRNELLHANQMAVRAVLKKMNSISALLIDTFPILQYYPSWLPGGGFQKSATDCRACAEHVRYRPWESVVRDTDLGIKRNSLASRLVELNGPTDAVRDAVAFLYAAGAETTTTSSLIGVFILLMYPDVQAKAHAEFDALIGHDRPPTPEDQLPYIEAVWKEVLRWHAPTPLGIPHVSSQEEVWDGYHIPQGTTIFANIGAMLHDPQIWENPEIFDPDRFLVNVKPGTYDPQSVVFGFGRRLCPGKALADRVGFNLFAAILWAFHIDPLPGEERPTPTTATFIDAAASPPVPFRCVFTPRSEKIAMTCMRK